MNECFNGNSMINDIFFVNNYKFPGDINCVNFQLNI